MSRRTIRVYTDYRSPYAYLADADIHALEKKHDVTLDWYPYILPIEQYLGTEDHRTGHQWRRIKYAYKDARRLAEEEGLVLYGAKRLFDGYYSSAGLLFAKQHGFFPAYHQTVFSRVFNRDLQIDDLAEMAQAIEQAGGSADGYREWAEGDGREAVRAVVAEAEDLGVFGVPMMIYNDELFWGRDRIPLLEKRLRES